MREIFYNSLAAFIPALGLKGLNALSECLGAALWRALPKRRNLAERNIAERLDLPPLPARAMAKKAFVSNASSFLEMLFVNQFDYRVINERVDFARPDLFEALKNDRQPAIVATAHLGAWEFLNPLMTLSQTKRPERIVVVRRTKDQAMNRLMFKLRSRPGVKILPHRQAVFPILKALRRGGVAAFLVDHNCVREEAVFLPFLDKIAAVNIGPAILAVRSKAKIWPVFLLRQPEKGRYILHQEKPFDTGPLNGSREENFQAAAEFYTLAVEKYVRLYPEQWFWMHNRWKTRPTEE